MQTLSTILVWAISGLIIGLIARALYPGRQPMGFLATMVLGIAGSLVGGFISWAFGFRPEDGAFRGSGFFMSVIGSLVVVWLSLYAMSSRSGRYAA